MQLRGFAAEGKLDLTALTVSDQKHGHVRGRNLPGLVSRDPSLSSHHVVDLPYPLPRAPTTNVTTPTPSRIPQGTSISIGPKPRQIAPSRARMAHLTGLM